VREVRKLLCLSTAHVSKETADILDSSTPKNWPVFGFGGEYGWVIYAHDEQDLEIPPDLWALCEYARSFDCDYIMLDCDASVIESLPTYEW
jgi:hypothetical protein